MDFIDDIIDWFKGLFSSNDGVKNTKAKKWSPPYQKTPYDSRTIPDLNEIPEDLAKFAVSWFVSSGMSIQGAAATVANLWRESYLNPSQLQIISGKPKGPGRGLAQWTDSTLTGNKKDDGLQRWDQYKNDFFPMLKRSNKFWDIYGINEIEPQLAYIVYEMREKFPGVWRNMTSTGSVSQKAINVLTKYEISKDRNEKEEQNFRANLAEKIYNIVKNDSKLKKLVAARKGSK